MAARLISRETIADSYICGTGIEIGALCNPLRVPDGVSVKYVDRFPVEHLRRHYPELANLDLVPVDIIADGELLDPIGDGSLDFVIANHFVEHCQNPILAVANMLRVLRKGGVLYIALPDKRYTFDKERPLTTIEHLVRDYREGVEWSRRSHCEEWARFVNKVRDEDEVQRQISSLLETNYSIHYHVFTTDTAVAIFLQLKDILQYAFDYELFFRNEAEVIVILRRL